MDFILGTMFIAIFIFAIKSLFRVKYTLSVLILTLYAVLIGFITEIVFQIVRLSTFSGYNIQELLQYFYNWFDKNVFVLYDIGIFYFLSG